MYRILHYIRVTPKLARPYKVTDELFDLSTMAMEYFKEHIEPTLPEIAYFGTDFLDFTGSIPCKLINLPFYDFVFNSFDLSINIIINFKPLIAELFIT